MLVNIKSSYLIELLFIHVNEKRKLKLIKYNKSFQNLLDIKLINYIFFNHKYIIYDTKIKGKEYNGIDNNLIFEGEYKNGERNGKGKEYYNAGELYFEGEYKNGERNGKGKKYDYDGKIMFEGEYLNGHEWNGKRKDYKFNGVLIFEGEYINGKLWKAKRYENNNIYELKEGNGFFKNYI